MLTAVLKYVLAQTQTGLSITRIIQRTFLQMQKSWEASSSAGVRDCSRQKVPWLRDDVLATLADCNVRNEYAVLPAVTGHDKKTDYCLMKELCMSLR